MEKNREIFNAENPDYKNRRLDALRYLNFVPPPPTDPKPTPEVLEKWDEYVRQMAEANHAQLPMDPYGGLEQVPVYQDPYGYPVEHYDEYQGGWAGDYQMPPEHQAMVDYHPQHGYSDPQYMHHTMAPHMGAPQPVDPRDYYQPPVHYQSGYSQDPVQATNSAPHPPNTAPVPAPVPILPTPVPQPAGQPQLSKAERAKLLMEKMKQKQQ